MVATRFSSRNSPHRSRALRVVVAQTSSSPLVKRFHLLRTSLLERLNASWQDGRLREVLDESELDAGAAYTTKAVWLPTITSTME